METKRQYRLVNPADAFAESAPQLGLVADHSINPSVVSEQLPKGSSESVVAAKRLGFQYAAGLRAIDDISFDLRAGEILSIVGPSGCGKSTLLRLLAGLRAPTQGQVLRNFGKGERHGCSMVFQEDTLLPWLTVKDNVGLYYKFNKADSHRPSEHIAELLKMVKLSDYEKFYPYQLSGGMKRRVAMLSAIAPLPDLLLLDEPFSALDEPTRIAVHRDLYMLLRRLKISAILVTHDLAEAISLSDRILILSKPPATIVEEIRVPFGTERDMVELRDNPEFLKLYGYLWHSLKNQISWDRQ